MRQKHLPNPHDCYSMRILVNSILNWEKKIEENRTSVPIRSKGKTLRWKLRMRSGAPTPAAYLQQGRANAPAVSSMPTVSVALPKASRVAPCARNGACTVRGGGGGVILSVHNRQRNPAALSHANHLGRWDWCEHETGPGSKCPGVPDHLEIECESQPRDAGKPHNVCQTGWLRNRA